MIEEASKIKKNTTNNSMKFNNIWKNTNIEEDLDKQVIESKRKVNEYLVKIEDNTQKAISLLNEGKLEEAEKYIEKAKEYAQKAKEEMETLSQNKKISQEEKKILKDILKELDKTLISLSKLQLSVNDTLRNKTGNEIFENTITNQAIARSEQERRSAEEINAELVKYYLVITDMKRDIEKINKEESDVKKREEKIKEVYEEYYDELKNGNAEHDATLNAFLIYNIAMELGSEEMKDKIAEETVVTMENGEKTSLKKLINNKIIELYNACINTPGWGWDPEAGCFQLN